jgi:hypothetical protein
LTRCYGAAPSDEVAKVPRASIDRLIEDRRIETLCDVA